MIVDFTKTELELDLERRQICTELINNHAWAARLLGFAKVTIPDQYPDLHKFIKTICKSRK